MIISNEKSCVSVKCHLTIYWNSFSIVLNRKCGKSKERKKNFFLNKSEFSLSRKPFWIHSKVIHLLNIEYHHRVWWILTFSLIKDSLFLDSKELTISINRLIFVIGDRVWKDYVPIVDSVVFAVDAIDRHGFAKAKKEFHVSIWHLKNSSFFY